jgi:SAM-dependent methyltransferase
VVTYQEYTALKHRFLPRLRFNQEIYEDAVAAAVSGDTVWLDAGCGKHILPPWREDAERALVGRARLVVGCDVNLAAVRQHRTLHRLVVADLERLPLRPGSVSLITCDMVFEHLDRPRAVCAEFARALRPGGRVIVHTPNAYSHFVVASRFVPRRLKLKLVQALEGRSPEDVFPTRYRANVPRKLRAMMASAGLQEESCSLLATDAMLALTHPLLARLELMYIRLTLAPACRGLRASILARFVKHGGGA